MIRHNLPELPPEQFKKMQELLDHGAELYYPNMSVEVVILGYHERSLKVLLVRPYYSENWILPGRLVMRMQTLEEAAEQTVRERTRLENLELYQCRAFSKPGRDQDYAEVIKQELRDKGFVVADNSWIFQTRVSTCFYALTEYSLVNPSGDFFNEECAWHDISDLPELIYDHREMIDCAMRTIRKDSYFRPIGYSLLPEKFTLPDIHALYETILNRKLDQRNFAKKLTNLGLIKKMVERLNIGAHRSPYLYIFDKAKYDELLEKNDAVII